jgi:hypothetical protein
MDFMHDLSLSLSAVYPGNTFLGAVCIGSLTVEVNSNTDNPNCHFKIEIELREKKQLAKVIAMIDSGAQGSFMHQEFAVTNKVPMHLMWNLVRQRTSLLLTTYCLELLGSTTPAPTATGAYSLHVRADQAYQGCQ